MARAGISTVLILGASLLLSGCFGDAEGGSGAGHVDAGSHGDHSDLPHGELPFDELPFDEDLFAEVPPDGPSLALRLVLTSSSVPEVDGDPIAVEDLAAAYTDAYCRSNSTCCEMYGKQVDEEFCSWLQEDMSGTVSALMDLPDVTYDPDAAGDCIATLQQVVSGCNDNIGPLSCDRIFVGSRPEGDVCEASAQCAAPAGYVADCDFEVSPSTCLLDAVDFSTDSAKQGDPCGETCYFRGSFEEGCVGVDAVQHDGICSRNQGLHCAAATSTCQPSLGAAEPCTDDLMCAVGLRCLQGACAPPGESGAQCDAEALAPQCAATLVCVNGSCLAPLPSGAACNEDEACGEGAYCDGGSCKRFAEDNLLCVD